jgi:hypothetical protein
MSNNPETSPGLLPETYQDLHISGEVEWAVQRESEHVPDDPHQRVATYLGSLVGRHGLMGGSEERRQAQVSHHVMDPEDIPESYFDRQREIARQQGHGDIEITEDMRRQHSEALIADQTASLNAWAEYLNDPHADYPAWFRYYTMRNVLKLADYDTQKGRFRKRSNKTTAPYPELNREALAYVYERLNRWLEGQEQNDEQIQELAARANFNKLYSHALAECVPSDQEQLQSTAGEWTKYKQLGFQEGSHRAHQLAESLQGYGTGWCTAGESTAKMHLEQGDFHVYYSYDEDGQATVPRVAVRMQNGKVAEVRGIETGENLEPAMTDIAMELVKDLPGGEKYLQAAEDMNRVTDIEARARQGQELTIQDIYFLREYGGRIQGFGAQKDPRIGELLQDRDPEVDLDMALENFDHAQLARDMMDGGWRGMKILAENLDKFPDGAIDHAELAWDMMRNLLTVPLAENLDKFRLEVVDQAELARHLMNNNGDGILAYNLDKFQPEAVDHTELAWCLMNRRSAVSRKILAENLDKFRAGAIDQAELAYRLLDEGREEVFARNLDKFQPEAVDHAELARHMMGNNLEVPLAQNLDKFQPEAVDHAELARHMMGNNLEVPLAQNLDKFQPEAVDHSELARNMVDNGLSLILVENLDKFQPEAVDHSELARDMVDNGLSLILARNLDKFQDGAIDHAQLARNLVDEGEGHIVAENLDKFQELPDDVRDRLPIAA